VGEDVGGPDGGLRPGELHVGRGLEGEGGGEGTFKQNRIIAWRKNNKNNNCLNLRIKIMGQCFHEDFQKCFNMCLCLSENDRFSSARGTVNPTWQVFSPPRDRNSFWENRWKTEIYKNNTFAECDKKVKKNESEKLCAKKKNRKIKEENTIPEIFWANLEIGKWAQKKGKKRELMFSSKIKLK